MTLSYFLCTSTANLDTLESDVALANLVDQAKAANARIGITGALMFTGKQFVHLLEGRADALERVANRIASDARHSDIIFLSRGPIPYRSFEGFSLAYAGPSVFVARKIAYPLAQLLCGSKPDVGDLVRLMVEFARQAAQGIDEQGSID
jgi:hypothetical protein